MKKYLTEIVLLLGCVAIYLIGYYFNSDIRVGYNLTQIIRHASMLGIFAIGAGIVIIAGGIDLSSGSMIAFGGSICCLVIMSLSAWIATDDSINPTIKVPIWIYVAGIAATLLVGFLIGTLHTWLITVVELPPFVATLASLVGLRSLARILNQAVQESIYHMQMERSDGTSSIVRAVKVNIQDDAFSYLGSKWWVPLTIFIVVAISAWVLMNKTVLGRHLYAMGGNEEAARLSGIRTDRLKWVAYCIGTMTAAIAGILYSSDVTLSDPQTQGMGYELFAIAAAVVGGCSLQGGVGRVTGIALGAIFLRVVIDAVAKVIRSGSDDYEGLIVGLLVVLAVAFNQLSGQKAGWKKQFFPGSLGLWTIPILGGLITAVFTAGSVLTPDGKPIVGVVAGGIVTILLLAMKFGVDIVGKEKA